MQLICNTNINGDISFNKKHKLKTIILATLAWGLIAHAYILFNEIAYHDAAINISSVGASIISGRWMLKVMYFISESLFLEGIFATPVINGLFTLAVLGVITYIISEMLLDHTRIEINSKWITQKNIRRFICILLLFLNFLYCRFSNMCYIKAEITQTRYLDYMETLSNTIVSLEDYDKDVSAAYIGDLKKTNLFDYMNDQLAAIRLHPYDVISSLDGRTWINDYAWKETMALWCGFSPVLVDNTYEWEQHEEVKNMPVYPKTGSVRMVNGAVVVKFSEIGD